MKNVIRRMKYIYCHYGWHQLVYLICTFLVQRLFVHGRYYLLARQIPDKIEGSYLPRIPEYSSQMVANVAEADQLVARGLDFYSTALNARERLRKGSIACCVLVGTDIVHIGWIALSEEAKNTWNPFPYRVDFQHGEACSGGAVTLPEFEGKGLMTFGLYQRLEFLRKQGIKKSHTITAVNNAASLKVQSKLAFRIYAQVDYIKILRWRYWHETPFNS
jgi:RimJ/RimL family protein N-acetyltransferase